MNALEELITAQAKIQGRPQLSAPIYNQSQPTSKWPLRSSSEPIQSEDKAISLATSGRNRLKGMRRRAAKVLASIRADRFDYHSSDMDLQADLAAEMSVELQDISKQLQSSLTDGSSAGLEAVLSQLVACLEGSPAVQLAHAAGLLVMLAQAVAEPDANWSDRLNMSLGDVLLRLLAWEENCYVVLANGLAEGLLQRLAALLDQYIAKEGTDKELCKDSAALDQLLQVACCIIAPLPGHAELAAMRSLLVSYTLASGIVHRVNELFSLFDKPQGEKAAPFPSFVVLALHLLGSLTSQSQPPLLQDDKTRRGMPPYAASIILTLKDVGLAGMLSLLTAILLHIMPSSIPPTSQPDYTALPHNFCTVAEAVLRVVNNAALLDLTCLQRMLGGADLRVEIFHVFSFLLVYAAWCWASCPSQVEGLMHELLLCVGMFTVLEPRNQDVLLWGKVPTPVHKLCTLFDGLSGQPSVASSLRCTLLAVCIPNQPICAADKAGAFKAL
ncbi:hypothetical protein ABBQ32_001269 [Trebouxia sp. C0010 RCD-2024]